MSEPVIDAASNDAPQESAITFWDMHQFSLLVILAITASLVLVGVSLALYASSGAAQLDLSRPGYKTIISQGTTDTNDFENYSPSGALDQESMDEFRVLYGKQADKAKAVDAFSGDPLNPDVLEISAPETE